MPDADSLQRSRGGGVQQILKRVPGWTLKVPFEDPCSELDNDLLLCVQLRLHCLRHALTSRSDTFCEGCRRCSHHRGPITQSPSLSCVSHAFAVSRWRVEDR